MLNISLGISNISFKVTDNSYETKFMFPRPAVPFRVEIELLGNVGLIYSYSKDPQKLTTSMAFEMVLRLNNLEFSGLLKRRIMV